MWIVLAIISAISAGFVSITVKVGMKNVDSNLGTFLRTLVVLIFTFIMVVIVGSLSSIKEITLTEWVFIIASGLCTGFSWLCYFKALQKGEVSKVVAVDKLSTVLTMTLAIIIFSEPFWWLTFVAMALMITGTMLMINKKKYVQVSNAGTAGDRYQSDDGVTKKTLHNGLASNSWFVFALLSLIFASLTSILAKQGMQSINSHLGTFLRTIVVAIMAFLIVIGKKNLPEIKKMTKLNWVFLTVSGILTGISWLCYYAAIQTGMVSVVVPIDKLSVLVTVVFSYLLFKEKLNLKSLIGLVLLVGGTLLLLV